MLGSCCKQCSGENLPDSHAVGSSSKRYRFLCQSKGLHACPESPGPCKWERTSRALFERPAACMWNLWGHICSAFLLSGAGRCSLPPHGCSFHPTACSKDHRTLARVSWGSGWDSVQIENHKKDNQIACGLWNLWIRFRSLRLQTVALVFSQQ